ncbi:hypothetical protein FISHEDRAFT_43931, partial [Fistulina hepatica ATCC 64428]
GMSMVHIFLFFSLVCSGKSYLCAYIHWFNKVGNHPDPVTRMWHMEPDLCGQHREPYMSIMHVDSLVHGTRLILVYGAVPVPIDMDYMESLNMYSTYYVNCYIDHHAFETIF